MPHILVFTGQAVEKTSGSLGHLKRQLKEERRGNEIPLEEVSGEVSGLHFAAKL